jgi:hypothetical protein
MGKIHVTQLIHVIVWKHIYIDYQVHPPYLVFAIETVKDCLCDTLKEFKTITSNEKG